MANAVFHKEALQEALKNGGVSALRTGTPVLLGYLLYLALEILTKLDKIIWLLEASRAGK